MTLKLDTLKKIHDFFFVHKIESVELSSSYISGNLRFSGSTVKNDFEIELDTRTQQITTKVTVKGVL